MMIFDILSNIVLLLISYICHLYIILFLLRLLMSLSKNSNITNSYLCIVVHNITNPILFYLKNKINYINYLSTRKMIIVILYCIAFFYEAFNIFFHYGIKYIYILLCFKALLFLLKLFLILLIYIFIIKLFLDLINMNYYFIQINYFYFIFEIYDFILMYLNKLFIKITNHYYINCISLLLFYILFIVINEI